MKIVINMCYGGFGLSPRGLSRLAELQGRKCYFYEGGLLSKPHKLISLEQAEKSSSFFVSAYDVPNIDEVCPSQEDFHKLSIEGRRASNEVWRAHTINQMRSYEDRSNPLLVQVVEELGSEVASSRMAELAVVEIPDGVEYEIDDYDGIETIHEKHRTWG